MASYIVAPILEHFTALASGASDMLELGELVSRFEHGLHAIRHRRQMKFTADRVDNLEAVEATLASNVLHLHMYFHGNRYYLCRNLSEEAEGRADVLWSTASQCSDLALPEHSFSQLQQAERKVLASIRALKRDQCVLLKRLGFTAEEDSARVIFLNALALTRQDATRDKFLRAWKGVQRRHSKSLVNAIEALATARRAIIGVVDELDTSFRFSSSGRAKGFFADYLRYAMTSCHELGFALGAYIHTTTTPIEHLDFSLRGRFGQRNPPVAAFCSIVDFVKSVTERFFGLQCRYDNQNLELYSKGKTLGVVCFDLIRPRKNIDEVGTQKQTPIGVPQARVLCRVADDDGNKPICTFESTRSILHEFGHALTHIIYNTVDHSSPSLCVSADRFEILSTWFEFWILSKDILPLFPCDGDSAATEYAQAAMRIEFMRGNVERATTALLDLELHGNKQCLSLDEIFKDTVSTFGLTGQIDIVDMLRHFSDPLFLMFPGGAVAYVVGPAIAANFHCKHDSAPASQGQQLIEILLGTGRVDILALLNCNGLKQLFDVELCKELL